MSRQTTPPSQTPQGQRTSFANVSGTPVTKKRSGYEPHSSTILTRDERFKDMWSEINKHVVGPMPVEDFLTRFLRPEGPPIRIEAPAVLTKSLEVYVKDKKYESLIAALQPICSSLEFKDTHSKTMTTFQQFAVRPDICVVNRGITDVNITNAEILMELKPDNHDDPFDDNGTRSIVKDGVRISEDYFVKDTVGGKDTLGQTTLYAAAHQSAQFRTHIFSVLIFPKHARLMRWDRSGVIVTESLSIFSQLFVEFFQLYEHATPSKRGIDTSVSLPSPVHISEARASFASPSLASASLAIDPTLPLVQLSLSSDASYIVSKKTFMNLTHSPLGRSTRTFIAYSTSRQCNVFLKDSWRLESQTREHEIYEQLRLKGVKHIATVVEGADILDHATLTQDILRENPEWIKAPPRKPLRKHNHYRLVLEEIATPLRSFPSTQILVTAIRDAIIAHQDAYLKAGILHRDISSGNIMIYNNGGLLIDWDLSKSIQEEKAREMERTGTWQFISARLLEDPTAVQNLTDDVESFVHVITWVSFQYAKHNMTDEAVKAFFALVFDHGYYEKDGIAKGGDSKSAYLVTPKALNRTIFESPNLKKLMQRITKTISVRYKEAPSSGSEDDSGDSGESGYHRRRQLKHARKKAKLETSTWIISEFNSALSLPNWPAEDGVKDDKGTQVVQLDTHTADQPSGSKRRSSEDDDAMGKSKKLRALTSGSGKGKEKGKGKGK